jgi:CBS domain-containing protein
MRKEVLVKEAMKYNPVIIQPHSSVRIAAQAMKRHNIGNVLIVEDDQLIGILTESDILKKVVAENKNPETTTVEQIMNTPVLVIDPYISIEEALQTMAKSNVRRLPVVENKKLVGIITQRDISRISPIYHEIVKEWSEITSTDETYRETRIFSGKCEDCGVLSPQLKYNNGRLLCDDCIDALKYE